MSHGLATFDALADRTIQSLVGAPVTGRFDARTAQEVATFPSRAGLRATGIADQPTADVMLRLSVRAGRYDEGLHLVMVVFAIDLGSVALSIRFNAALPTDASSRADPRRSDGYIRLQRSEVRGALAHCHREPGRTRRRDRDEPAAKDHGFPPFRRAAHGRYGRADTAADAAQTTTPEAQ